ncbi:LysR family transcriptional regulator [Bradyrhizobium stylosanthis]|uniref:DNA-binding transcriptional LysR family regulator n=1 Tax=Bradyrhizobium stylosanthis TaxID=1803665 RepID=A0A560DNN4_9BRAD|nr:LysR family transcriptional regulator [Bradyrhizobium stylosanthis]TWA98729.1 DNA-binding transcriptional LysR family regulator [Bradyrhizobium stylosanthis]
MDLIWLEDFLAIAEERGFSRAAERRHVTQPALSRRIRSLEEWLGTQLFERSTHTVTLTAAGESFRPVAEDVLRRVQVGREEALEVARLKAETITFAATHALSQTFFPEWIRSSESARAGAAVQLVASNFAGCEKLLLDAQAHFMLAHYHPSLVSRLDMDRFQRIELATDILIPISAPAAKPGRGARSKKSQPRYALPGASGAPLPYLAYHPGSGVGRLVTSFLAAKDPSAWLAPGFAAPVMLLIDMAREGRGVTWAPMTLVRADLDTGRLLRAGGAEWNIPISVSLFRTRARMTRAAENFWSAVRKGRPAGKAAAAPRAR